jgi:uncharacterized protein (TIGR03083 family)
VSPLDTAYAGITRVVQDLDDLTLLRPSGCRGWSIADLLLHLTMDAQRALVAFATPAARPADVDAVSYWRTPEPPDDPVANVVSTRRAAAAFARPSGVVRQWTELAPAAVRAAAAVDPDTRISTQGHVLTVPDFVTTLVTEAVIHHFDLIVALPEALPPDPASIAVALSTLEGLAAPDGLPSGWEPREALLKSTGRAPLDPDDRPVGDRWPLLS